MGVLRGGRFKEGFLSGFAGHYLPNEFESYLPDGGGADAIATRTAFAAMSGGIVAKMGGGKFENGVKTAAFVHLFNAELGR